MLYIHESVFFLIKLIIFSQLCERVQMLNNTLVLVHVIIRHCDRTPEADELYTRSPYYNESNYEPYGYGQLTNDGKKRCYDIGTSLKQRYNDFLNSTYHYTLIEGRSTDYMRTKESLQLVLAGLFPPNKELTWLDGMNWLPIATVYEKKQNDKLLYPFGSKKFQQEIALFMKTKESEAYGAPFRDTIEFFSQQIQEPVDFKRLQYLARGMVLQEAFGLPLPEWLTPPVFDLAKKTLIEYILYSVGTKQLKRIFGGYLLKKIVEDTEMKINGSLTPANRKLFLYTGHQYTIHIIFIMLELWNTVTFPVGSYCIFEVHQVNGTYGFKFFNFNYTTNEPELISIPGFGEFMPLDEFKMKKQDFLQLDDLNEPSLATTHSVSTIFLLLLACLLPQWCS